MTRSTINYYALLLIIIMISMMMMTTTTIMSALVKRKINGPQMRYIVALE